MKGKNWMLGDIELHDLVYHTSKTLKAGVVPKYDGCKWILSGCCNGGNPGNPGGGVDHSAEIETLNQQITGLKNRLDQQQTTIATQEQTINQLNEWKNQVTNQLQTINQSITQVQQNIQNIQENPAVDPLTVDFKIAEVQMTGQTATITDPFITEKTIATYTYLNGDPAGHITMRVETGNFTISSEAPENGRFIILFVKPK